MSAGGLWLIGAAGEAWLVRVTNLKCDESQVRISDETNLKCE